MSLIRQQGLFSTNKGWRGTFEGTRDSDKRKIKVTVDGFSKTNLGRDGTAYGISPSAYGGVVYIDKKIDDATLALATAIHEIGNGLNNMRDMKEIPSQSAVNPLLREWDLDGGQALEECVFGGYVGTGGYIYEPYRIQRR